MVAPFALARRAARAAASPLVVAALAAPPATAALLAWAGALAPEDFAAARSVRLWAGAAAVAIVLVAVRLVVERRVAAALAAGATLALAGYAAAAFAPRLDASADVGLGEQGAAWRIARGSADAAPPDVAVLGVEEPGGAIRLGVLGREVLVAPGREVAAPAGLLVSADVHPAPEFSLRRASGALEGAGLLKLVPGAHDYFQIAVLPHRFYVTIPEAAPGGSPAERVRLRVQRGKVKVLEREVALPGAVEFEGMTLRLGRGERWARVRVRSAPPRWALAAAATLGIAAAAAAWRARGGRA